jgi:hypothetical protein
MMGGYLGSNHELKKKRKKEKNKRKEKKEHNSQQNVDFPFYTNAQ